MQRCRRNFLVYLIKKTKSNKVQVMGNKKQSHRISARADRFNRWIILAVRCLTIGPGQKTWLSNTRPFDVQASLCTLYAIKCEQWSNFKPEAFLCPTLDSLLAAFMVGDDVTIDWTSLIAKNLQTGDVLL